MTTFTCVIQGLKSKITKILNSEENSKQKVPKKMAKSKAKIKDIVCDKLLSSSTRHAVIV